MTTSRLERILYVEDEPDIQTVRKMALEEERFRLVRELAGYATCKQAGIHGSK